MRIEGQILKPPLGVEGAHIGIEWMCDDANAADDLSGPNRGFESKQQERRCMRSPLVVLVDRELSEKRHRHRIGLIALLRLGQEGTLDLRGTQGDIARNGTRSRIAYHVDPRSPTYVIGPSVSPKPGIHGLSSAIKRVAIVILGERTRRRYLCHVGVLRPSRLSAGLGSAG